MFSNIKNMYPPTLSIFSPICRGSRSGQNHCSNAIIFLAFFVDQSFSSSVRDGLLVFLYIFLAAYSVSATPSLMSPIYDF
jgi:hypothetical protein